MARTVNEQGVPSPTIAEALYSPASLYDGWHLWVHCPTCRMNAQLGIAHLTRARPQDTRIIDVVAKLRCRRCNGRPAQVQLFDHHQGTTTGRQQPIRLTLLQAP